MPSRDFDDKKKYTGKSRHKLSPKQVLAKAASYLVRRGWLRGNGYGTTDGPCCMVGAVNVVQGLAPFANLRDSDAGRLLMRRMRRDENSIARWNDADGRKKHEVLARLRKAAS